MPPEFLNYLSMPTRVPLRWWHAIRFVSVAGLVGITVALLVRPICTLILFWGVIIPVLPAVFLIAPGSWRNVCPLAALNQASRNVGVTSQRPAPNWLKEFGFSIATTLFFGIALSRKVLFNRNGTALALLLVAVMLGAALGGRFLQGKSGWCSSICPLLPVQRVYGQTPFIGVPNSHCRPCLGCTVNCYDFNPRVAYVADMHEPDPGFRGPRRLFVGAFPGLVVGFFVVPDAGRLSVIEVYGRCLVWIAGGVALFALLDGFGRFSPNTLPPLFGAAAFALFYWYGSRRVATSLGRLFGGDWGAMVVPTRVAAIALVVVWVARSRAMARKYAREVSFSTPVQIDLSRARLALGGPDTANAAGSVEVDFAGRKVVVRSGTSLLEAAESAELSIEAGCRMGVCGADPVAVVRGYDAVQPIRREEADTLERLGLGLPNRMACVARAEGNCSVSLTPDRTSSATPRVPQFVADASVERVVIIGNGIGGVTAADFVRRNHPDCEIAVVGSESHQLYNRMAVTRLIHGRSAMHGLYLLPTDWYEKNRISLWLNTRAVAIDRALRQVQLGTGERIGYDRLVLAVGGRATVPDIVGFGLPGCFVLRDADDAMRIRAYAQEHDQHRAVVAGGGLLGLEAAHALHTMGMTVTVLERSARLLRTTLDATASDLLRGYFEASGIPVFTESEVERVDGEERLRTVVTATGQHIDSEVLLVAAGITPNIDLARRAGLAAERGVIVDDHLRTSDPDIYAVGDLAEFGGRVLGVWPVAVRQAQVAAVNIAGGDRTYVDEIPTTILKGVGLDVHSFGRIEPAPGDRVVSQRGDGGQGYRKIVVAEGRVVGGVFLDFADEATQAADAVSEERVFSDEELDRIAAGDWSPLGRRPTAVIA